MASEMATVEGLTRPLPDRKITYEEFLEWADEDTWAEWVDGEIILMSPVSDKHQSIGLFLLRLVAEYVEYHDLGRVFYEPFQMKTAPNLPGRSPNFLFVAQGNLGRVKETYLDGPADLAVEIVSPGGRKRDREAKYSEYEKGGVREYWVIDPQLKYAEFYHLGPGPKYEPIPVDEVGIARSRVLDGFWLKVEWLWQEPLPSLMYVLREWRLI